VNKLETPIAKYRIKIDPGSKHTGIAVVREADNAAMLFMQIEHRAEFIVKNLQTRNAARRNRRQRETRYRRCKFINHYQKKDSKYEATTPRPDGWLPPSVKSIGDNVINWVNRLGRLINITNCSFEAVRFDTQLMDNPEISGKEYQSGTLLGYEIKEYLLDKYTHTCQYCGGASKDPILEWEHIVPRSKGGSDSIKNATLACHTCNQDKGNLSLTEWLEQESKLKTKLAKARTSGIAKVMAGKTTSASDRYCAWANASRRYIERDLFKIFGEGKVECSSGGRTKFNRMKLNLPKDHHFDALCVGNVPEKGYKDLAHGYCLYVTAIGRGTRFRSRINKCGVIMLKLKKTPKSVFGFHTGDIVAVDSTTGKYKGHYVGRVMTRASGYFSVRTTDNEVISTKYDKCKVVQYNNGYRYSVKKTDNKAIPLDN
jgi:5-methylcytosine-specific restriction endonuclease McrA